MSLFDNVASITHNGKTVSKIMIDGAVVWQAEESYVQPDETKLWLQLTSNLEIKLATTPPSKTLLLDWGDGSEVSSVESTNTHTYSAPGNYIITISLPEGASYTTYTKLGGTVTNIFDVDISENKTNTSPELTAIQIGKTATIKEYSLGQCTSLKEIILPANITELGSYTFYGCISLHDPDVKGTITSIGIYCFGKCVSLSENQILSASSISYRAYMECTQLRKVWIRDTVTQITGNEYSNGEKKYAGIFYGCSDDLVIYCESDSKPSGWDSEWDAKSGDVGSWVRHTVIWGQKTRPW